MSERIVFWGLCAVLFFVPLPIGSVEEWAVFAFEAATIALFLIFLYGRLGRRSSRSVGTDRGFSDFGNGENDRFGYDARLPGFVKIALGVFLAISALQIVPLPASVVAVISPRAYAVYVGLVENGIAAPSAWLTLSLAPSVTLPDLVLIVCYGLFGYLVLRTVRTRSRIEAFVLVILAAALFQSFYGMAEVFSGHEAILGRAKRYNVGSVTGTFVNRNHLAGFLEMAFPLSLGYLLVKARYFAMEKGLSLRQKVLWFGQESLQWTFLLSLVPVFIGVGLVFSKSRSGITVFVITAVLAAVATASWRAFASEAGEGEGSRPAGHGVGRVVRLVVAAVLVAAVWLGLGPVIERFSEVDITAEGRRTFYANTLEMIGDFPLAGTGKGTYVNAYPIYEKVDDGLRLSYAHNDYLEFAAENGAVGGGALAVAGVGLAVWLAAMWRRRRSATAKGIGLGALLGVVAILIHGITDFNLQIPANAVTFTALAMLGVCVLGGKKNEDEEGGGDRPKSASPWKALLGAALAVTLFVPALRDFLGFRHLGAYRRARTEARSVESAFPALEARLLKAVSVSPQALFRVELAHLYVEMARVANEAGRDEERDTFCDRAVGAYTRAIAANPIDAATHFETATAYLLYNYPLMTYQDRAKAYFREALALKPADETMNLNVVFLYFTWWPTLEEADKAYIADIYRAMAARDTTFPPKLEARWRLSYPTLDGLKAVLSELPPAQ